ncbi:hypothetical protein CRUP_032816 [Coryphaenoides rupestris]|nr:hypothetical protein CRUP_032816 [Coryphaenoides rupestris]
MNNGFEKIAGGQEPRSDPVCPREACTVPDAEQAMADGRTSSRTTLSSRINEFLDGFCKVYGSLIPLERYKSTVARASPSFQVVYKRHTLTLADLSTLAEHNWLNDQVHFLNTFFHQQLEAKGYEGVRRWTKQVSLFSKRLLLVPVHQEVHWCLVAAEPAQRTVRLYDSSECAAPPEVALRTPQQSNENDCGVFILEYCKRLAFKEPLTFSQKDIPNIRKRIYKELCERKLHV